MSYDNLKFGVILSEVFSQNASKFEQYDKTLELIESFDTAHYEIVWVGSRQLVKQDPLNIPVSFITDSLSCNKNIQLGLLLTPAEKQHIQIKTILELLGSNGDRLHFCILIKPAIGLTAARNFIEALLKHIKTKNILIGSETSPIAATIAGHYGLGLFTAAATTPGGKNALSPIWEVYIRHLKDSDHPVLDKGLALRHNWSVAGPMHISNTRKNAIIDTRGKINGLSDYTVTSGNQALKIQVNLNQSITIGSPRDAIKQLIDLQHSSGGFGTFLFHHHGWANPDATQKSYQLIAEKVLKHFQK